MQIPTEYGEDCIVLASRLVWRLSGFVFDEDTEDFFLIVCCDDVAMANELEFQLAWEVGSDDYLYYRGYTTKINYKTVYLGHEDLIVTLLD